MISDVENILDEVIFLQNGQIRLQASVGEEILVSNVINGTERMTVSIFAIYVVMQIIATVVMFVGAFGRMFNINCMKENKSRDWHIDLC